MSTATEWRYLNSAGKWVRRGYPDIDAGGGTPVGAGTATDIQNALTAAATGATIVLAPNTVYTGFESINQTYGLVFKSGQKLVGSGGTILDGSVLVTGWVLHSAGVWRKDGVLPAPYLGTWNGTTFSNDGGQSEIPFGNTTRPDLAGAAYPREQMWRDGVHMTRVMRLQDLTSSVVAGGDISNRFYQDFDTNRIYVNADPNGHEMRMSRARYLIQSADGSYPNALSGCALQNLTIRRFASKSQLGAATLNGSGWVVDNCLFSGNHAIGLHLANADNAWVHHNQFLSNGQLGMGHNSSDNTIVEDNEFGYNNTDSYWAADWESGGYKCTYSLNNVFRRNKVWKNVGVGAWWDIDNRNPQIYNNDIWDNQADGIRHEISYGGRIYNNWISGNGLYFQFGLRVPASPWGMLAVAGVNINSSPDVEVDGNILGPDPTRLVSVGGGAATAVHTRGNQNGVSAQMRARGSGGFGPRDLHNLNVHHNDITLTSYYLPDEEYTTGTQFGETVSGLRTQGVDTTLYFSATKNNRYDFNRYFIDVTTKKRFAWNQTYLTFTDWKSQSAAAGNPQEVNGQLLAAPRPGLRVGAGGDDGNWSSPPTGSGGVSSYSATVTANRVGDFDAADFARSSWVRFTNVQIPQAATIDTGVLELLVGGQSGGIPPMVIRGHLTGNSPPPVNRADVTDRPRTNNQVAWTPTTWPASTWIPSPSIVSILQEIVNRPDWTPGNAITVFLEPAEIGFTVQQQISFKAFDEAPSSAAGLLFTYH